MPAELPVVGQPPHRCGALLDHLSRRERVLAEAVLQGLGLRARHLLTLTVLRDRGPAGQAALADVLHIDRTNLVGLLNDLEQAGWIVRRRSSQDRRRHVVELTDEGRVTLARAEIVLGAVEDEIFAGLDGDEREALYRLLLKASGELTGAALRDDALRSGGSPPGALPDRAGEC